MCKGIDYYEKVMTAIKQGGLPLKHKEYTNIKEFHSKLLVKTKQKQKLREMKKFYSVSISI